jgi:DNA-binding LacI/PurR family transcriptional regulator
VHTMKVTISDVAKIAGVSKTTVSRVLNGNLNEVTQETRERVLLTIDQMNYTPNALAKGLKTMRTHVIGMVLSDLQNPFWTGVLEGAEDACRTSGYHIMICNARNDWKQEADLINRLRIKQVDGIIVNPTMKNHALFDDLIQDNYPLVSLNRRMRALPIETVVVDNIKGASMATEHLIRLGKKKIAIIVYNPEGISPRLERIEGYMQALNTYGIDVNDSLIHIIEDKKYNAYHMVKQMMTGHERPDAIFSTNNIMTLEILEAAKELQLKIPEDIALIGYDETIWSQHLDPPLTTVKQPTYEMGEVAAKRLFDLIASKERRTVNTHLLEPTLIIRQSCGFESRTPVNGGLL